MNVWQRQARRNDIFERGVPVTVPEFDGWKFFLRPLGTWNVHWKRAAQRMALADSDVADYLARQQSPGYVLTPEDQELDARMVRYAFADGCVAGFEGVTDENGEALAYSPAAARRLVDHFPALYGFLESYAADARNFPALSDDDKERMASGNSKPASLTPSERGGSIQNSSRSEQTTGVKKRRRKS